MKTKMTGKDIFKANSSLAAETMHLIFEELDKEAWQNIATVISFT